MLYTEDIYLFPKCGGKMLMCAVSLQILQNAFVATDALLLSYSPMVGEVGFAPTTPGSSMHMFAVSVPDWPPPWYCNSTDRFYPGGEFALLLAIFRTGHLLK
jgi:hypothetical protein